jgi:XTP/dITP diphosphohydrolase
MCPMSDVLRRSCRRARWCRSRGEVVVRGEWPGAIAREPRGDAGFGYDPVFIPNGADRTAAQLTSVEKDAVSHRGRALALLLPALRTLAG